MVVVLPAPLGPRKPKASPFGDLEVDVDDAAVRAIGLGQPVRPDDGVHGQSFLPALPACSRRNRSTMSGDLALHEGEYVTEFLESGLAGLGSVVDGVQAALRDLAEEAVDAAGAGEELLERLGRRR